MIRLKTLFLWLVMIVLSSCSPADKLEITITPSINLDEVISILPTISPTEVYTYAQLADNTTLEIGNSIYEIHCASCHGFNGEGQFPDAPMQADNTGRIGAPPHNESGHSWHHADELLFEIIHDGGHASSDMFYEMPIFGETLSDDEINAVLAYIKTMWTDEQRLIQAERSLQSLQQ